MKPRTRLVHPRSAPPPADNRPLVAPIYQSVKFTHDTLEATEGVWRHKTPGYSYSREQNPSLRELELALADLQGTDEALVVASGMAAVSVTLLGLLKAGDHVLLFLDNYLPTRQFVKQILGRFGVTHALVPIDDPAAIERAVAERPPTLIWFENPTNPLLKVADGAHLRQVADTAGALLVLDNTFAGPHQGHGSGVDLYVHSLTKSAAGHGDVMGGLIAGPKALIDRLRPTASLVGATLDPHAAFLIQRGLKTYFLRREAMVRSAERVATYLASHPAVARVHYPGLASHPRHDLARAQFEDFGTVVTIDLRGSEATLRAFTDALTCFSVAASLGSADSLIVPAQLLGTQGLSRADAERLGLTATTARLSIGLEDPEDLVSDLARALAITSATQ